MWIPSSLQKGRVDELKFGLINESLRIFLQYIQWTCAEDLLKVDTYNFHLNFHVNSLYEFCRRQQDWAKYQHDEKTIAS